MENTDITELIISELSKYRPLDDIIKTVCERTGMPWEVARQFVQRVHAEHRSVIIGRQNVLHVVLAITSIIGGLTISVVILVATLDGWIIFVLRPMPVPYLGNVILFGAGIAMTAGGIAGLVKLKERKKQ